MRPGSEHTAQCGIDATVGRDDDRTTPTPLVALMLSLLAVPGLGCGGDGGLDSSPPSGPSEDPAVMVKTAGDGQQGALGTLLSIPLEVTVTGESGNPVSGLEVLFTSTAGSVVPSRGRTGSDGRRSVRLTLPDQGGAVTVRASADGLSEVEFTAEAVAGEPNPYEFPIGLSGRFIVDDEDRPIFLNGATPWSLAVQLDSSEVEAYLDTRVEQGVNAILFNAIEHLYADDPPANAFGEIPFRGTLAGGEEDMTTLDSDYWDFVEWIVSEARDRGIVCLVVPAYIGFQFNNAGWSAELEVNGAARLSAYGDSLGRRFRSHGNVIWVIGGDWGPSLDDTDLSSELGSLVQGIERTMPEAIFTAHANRGNSALDAYDDPWLEVNTTYSAPADAAAELETDWERTNGDGEEAMPSIFIEGFYENEHATTPERLRSQMYWSLLGGAVGHFYGIHPVWPFEASSAESFGDSSAPPYDTWVNALQTEVAGDLDHVRRLIDSQPMRLLVPDWEQDVVTGGRADGAGYAAAARASDGSLVLVYIPNLRDVTVDMSSITTDSVATASWLDPRTGDRTRIGEFGTEADQTFTPPSNTDWLLVIEDTPH